MLGVWQIERRAWKLDLLERIATRVHAAPLAAPGPQRWPGISRATDEYRRITAQGHYLVGLDAHVRGVSEIGAGYWLLTPLETTTGFTVLVNRGFVPDERTAGLSAGKTTRQPQNAPVIGLLRLSEPNGRFLRRNEPAAERWFSRDVEAIAASRHLGLVAPYFIDIDLPADPDVIPVTGLTVTQFPNNHLQYALTWFTLGLMVLGAAGYVGRYEYRLRRLA